MKEYSGKSKANSGSFDLISISSKVTNYVPMSDLTTNYMNMGIPQKRTHSGRNPPKPEPPTPQLEIRIDTDKENPFWEEAVLNIDWLSNMFKMVCTTDPKQEGVGILSHLRVL
jgi:hypothetical protein